MKHTGVAITREKSKKIKILAKHRYGEFAPWNKLSWCINAIIDEWIKAVLRNKPELEIEMMGCDLKELDI